MEIDIQLCLQNFTSHFYIFMTLSFRRSLLYSIGPLQGPTFCWICMQNIFLVLFFAQIDGKYIEVDIKVCLQVFSIYFHIFMALSLRRFMGPLITGPLYMPKPCWIWMQIWLDYAETEVDIQLNLQMFTHYFQKCIPLSLRRSLIYSIGPLQGPESCWICMQDVFSVLD